MSNKTPDLANSLCKFSTTQELNIFLQELIESQQCPIWNADAAVILLNWAEKVTYEGNVLCGLSIAKTILIYVEYIDAKQLNCVVPIYLQLSNLVDLTVEWRSVDITLLNSFWEAVNKLLLWLHRANPECILSKIQLILSSLYNSFRNSTTVGSVSQTRLKSLNYLLENCGDDDKELFRVRNDKCLFDLLATLDEVGDYDFQTSIIEAVFRLTSQRERLKYVCSWFPKCDYALCICFSRIKDFDPDVRKFLNGYNCYLGENRNVHTFACSVAKLGHFHLQKPKIPTYDCLWVDFNMGSKSVSILFDRSNPDVPTAERIWETIIIYHYEVDKALFLSTIHGQSLVLTLNSEAANFFASPPSQAVLNLLNREFSFEFDDMHREMENICISLFGEKLQILSLDKMTTTRKLSSRKINAMGSSKASETSYLHNSKTDDANDLNDQREEDQNVRSKVSCTVGIISYKTAENLAHSLSPITPEDASSADKGESEEIFSTPHLNKINSSGDNIQKGSDPSDVPCENHQNIMHRISVSECPSNVTPSSKRRILKNLSSLSSNKSIYPVSSTFTSSNSLESKCKNRSNLKDLFNSSQSCLSRTSKKMSSSKFNVKVAENSVNSMPIHDASNRDNEEYVPTVISKTQENQILDIDCDEDIIPASYADNIYKTPEKNDAKKILLGFSGKAPSTKKSLTAIVQETEELPTSKLSKLFRKHHDQKTIVEESEEVNLKPFIDNLKNETVNYETVGYIEIEEVNFECDEKNLIEDSESNYKHKVGNIEIAHNDKFDVNKVFSDNKKSNIESQINYLVMEDSKLNKNCESNNSSNMSIKRDEDNIPDYINPDKNLESLICDDMKYDSENNEHAAINGISSSIGYVVTESFVLVEDRFVVSNCPQPFKNSIQVGEKMVYCELSKDGVSGQFSSENSLNSQYHPINVNSNEKNNESHIFNNPVFSTEDKCRVIVENDCDSIVTEDHINAVKQNNIVESKFKDVPCPDGMKTPDRSLSKILYTCTESAATVSNNGQMLTPGSNKLHKSISKRCTRTVKKMHKNKTVPPHYDNCVTPDNKPTRDKVHSKKKKLFDNQQTSMLEDTPPADNQLELNISNINNEDALFLNPLCISRPEGREKVKRNISVGKQESVLAESDPSDVSQNSNVSKFFKSRIENKSEHNSSKCPKPPTKKGKRKTVYSQNNSALSKVSPLKSPTSVYDLMDSPAKWLKKKESPKRMSLRTYRGKRGKPCYQNGITDSDSDWAPRSNKKRKVSSRKSPERPYSVEDSDSLEDSMMFKSLKPKKINAAVKPEKIILTRSTAKKQKQQQTYHPIYNNEVKHQVTNKRNSPNICESLHSSPEVLRNTSLNRQSSFEELVDVPSFELSTSKGLNSFSSSKPQLLDPKVQKKTKRSKRKKFLPEVTQMRTMLQTVLPESSDRSEYANKDILATTAINSPLFPPSPPNNTPNLKEMDKTLNISQSFEVTQGFDINGPLQSTLINESVIQNAGLRFSYVPGQDNSFRNSTLNMKRNSNIYSLQSPNFTDGLDSNLNFDHSQSSLEYDYLQAESEIPSHPHSDYSTSDGDLSKFSKNTYSIIEPIVTCLPSNVKMVSTTDTSINLDVGFSYQNQIQVHAGSSDICDESLIPQEMQLLPASSQESENEMQIPSFPSIVDQGMSCGQRIINSDKMEKSKESQASAANQDENKTKRTGPKDFTAAISALLSNEIITPVNKYSAVDNLETPKDPVPKKLEFRNGQESISTTVMDVLGLSSSDSCNESFRVPSETLHCLSQLLNQIDKNAREMTNRSFLAQKLIKEIREKDSNENNDE